LAASVIARAKWAADKVKELDKSWATFGDRHVCPEPPSCYYQRQVFFGVSSPSLREIEVRHDVGVDKIMWGSDHPHGNSGWDRTHVWLRSTFGQAGVTEGEARGMLGESAARFYGFDVDQLKVHAQRVGPAVTDVLRPPDPGELEEDDMLRWMLGRDG
jgi:Amidohydrolase